VGQVVNSEPHSGERRNPRGLAERQVIPLPALPQRHGLGGDVYEVLKQSIMDHIIEPGARLSIDALARELEVSQTPIREAMARLESDGLVNRVALRGYSASPVITRLELEDLFGLRLLLEPWAAGTAAERLDPDSAAALRTEMDSLTAVPDGTDYEVYKTLAAHDARFHDLLLGTAGNEAVRQAFERTHCHLHLFRLHYATGSGLGALREHRKVADAVLARKPLKARAAMEAHLNASLQRILAVFR
jgi:DNA-binding GntR family transcriptional regulator